MLGVVIAQTRDRMRRLMTTQRRAPRCTYTDTRSAMAACTRPARWSITITCKPPTGRLAPRVDIAVLAAPADVKLQSDQIVWFGAIPLDKLSDWASVVMRMWEARNGKRPRAYGFEVWTVTVHGMEAGMWTTYAPTPRLAHTFETYEQGRITRTLEMSRSRMIGGKRVANALQAAL